MVITNKSRVFALQLVLRWFTETTHTQTSDCDFCRLAFLRQG